MSETVMDVRLENFEGPLDLLLYLIRKNDLKVEDIPIAHITQEYLSYIDIMKELNLEMAGEFLVMASTLMQIKVQMLLPRPETEAEDGPDPRQELINKLLEYQRYKEAAGILSVYGEKEKDVFYRHSTPTFGQEDYILKSSMIDLLEAFQRVLQQAPKEVGQILIEEIPVEVKIREILDLLTQHDSIAFEELFKQSPRRIDKVMTFLALLELIRLRQAIAQQSDVFGAIRISRLLDVAEPISSQPQEVLS